MDRPAYFIAIYDITDPERYERDYVPGLVAQLAARGAEIVVATGSAEALEGQPGTQVVVLQFPSEAALRDWYEGDDYAPLKQLRLDTTANGAAVIARAFPGTHSPT